ncbi:Uncharacterised protein [Porphyromonas cangingivalis]|uniref:Uncharacterized protein n=1 Tax=Porphyromonas cangingivalis TaxID=36874 RepID=A0A1T4K196_PORCN|nr:hypothetical protein SAMN02745205_00503 [Porphyromonas cangingivalis]VEJ03343.1 Uncharacterised protein [Porphyromonas cangingivalis]
MIGGLDFGHGAPKNKVSIRRLSDRDFVVLIAWFYMILCDCSGDEIPVVCHKDEEEEYPFFAR